MLRQYSVKARLFFLSAVILVFIAGVLLAFRQSSQTISEMGVTEAGKAVLEGQKLKIEVASHSLAVSLGTLLEGVADTGQQEELLRAAVDKVRYESDESGYFFVYKGTSAVAMPVKKELVGQELSGLKDKNGVALVLELEKQAQAGGGFVEYIWPKPGAGDVPKLSYAEMIPGTNYWTGTGVYIDNVQAEKDRIGGIIGAKAQSALNWVLGSVAVMVLAVLLPLVLLVIRSIVRPMVETASLAESIAAGDLDVSINVEGRDEAANLQRSFNAMADSLRLKAALAKRIADRDLTGDVELSSERDSLGRALQDMTINLRELLGQVREASLQIAAGSTEVSDSSQSLSQGATEQAASLEQITSSMTEMGSRTRTNAENASKASEIARQQQDQAGRGATDMERMVEAMDGIRDAGNNIARIIKVIDEIAFQTNLLALNAAVEAARAGQHGKGFAVVAEEVRNLASRSAKAASETATMIADTIERVEKGVEIAKLTSDSLRKIVEGAGSVTELVQEIASASNEQAEGISQVGDGLSQIDTVTQTNTANAEETASAAEELSSQSQQLRSVLAGFKLKESGTGRVPALGMGSTHSGEDARQRDQFGPDDAWGESEEDVQRY
ncbi:MAG: methyl-accepting chemotaxis protein [Desulfovibrionaceae bacterium]